MNLKDHIRGIPDFPKPGILFYDISTLLAHPAAWQTAVERLAETVAPYRPAVLAGIESRGFLVAAPLALKLGCGFIMVRKQGKLPGATVGYSYDLEYGSDKVEIQADAVAPGQRVVLLDDLIATGGTLRASIELIRKVGGTVAAAACLIELTFLNGRDGPRRALRIADPLRRLSHPSRRASFEMAISRRSAANRSSMASSR